MNDVLGIIISVWIIVIAKHWRFNWHLGFNLCLWSLSYWRGVRRAVDLSFLTWSRCLIWQSVFPDLNISPSQLKSLSIDWIKIVLLILVDLLHKVSGCCFEIKAVLDQNLLKKLFVVWCPLELVIYSTASNFWLKFRFTFGFRSWNCTGGNFTACWSLNFSLFFIFQLLLILFFLYGSLLCLPLLVSLEIFILDLLDPRFLRLDLLPILLHDNIIFTISSRNLLDTWNLLASIL